METSLPSSASPATAAHTDVIGPDEVLSLPPPPSHPDMDDDAALRRPSASAPSSATAKASAAAMSLAAAAKSRLSQGGRMILAPLGPPGSHTAEKLGQGLGAAASSLNSLLFASDPAATGSPRADSDAADDAAAALRLVSTQQRTQLLEALVQCRRADWSYLKAMHDGPNYWLNIALLREQHVLAHVGEKPAARRGVQFFYLGLGLGQLLGNDRRPQLLALDGCQLLEELEFYFASAAVQGMVRGAGTESRKGLHKKRGRRLTDGRTRARLVLVVETHGGDHEHTARASGRKGRRRRRAVLAARAVPADDLQVEPAASVPSAHDAADCAFAIGVV